LSSQGEINRQEVGSYTVAGRLVASAGRPPDVEGHGRSSTSALRGGSCLRRPRARGPAVTSFNDTNVLLDDGEELLGPKQNRILDVTVLAAARSTTPRGDVRLSSECLVRSGLELDGELVELCAFTGDERSGRIARPSPRR
jgi:hypothetical protein